MFMLRITIINVYYVLSTIVDTLTDIIAYPHDSPGIIYFYAHLTDRRIGTQISNNTQVHTIR